MYIKTDECAADAPAKEVIATVATSIEDMPDDREDGADAGGRGHAAGSVPQVAGEGEATDTSEHDVGGKDVAQTEAWGNAPDPHLAIPAMPTSNVHADVVAADDDRGATRREKLSERIPIKLLNTNVQMRETDDGVVDAYLQLLKLGKSLPPIRVVRHERGDGEVVNYAVDGLHRIAARELNGETEIEADVIFGDLRTALWEVAGSNTTHGLQRTDLDKRRQLCMVFDDEEWRSLSDRQIAEHVGVSPTMVGKERRKHNEVRGVTQEQEPLRKAKDGRVFDQSRRKRVPSQEKVQDFGDDAAGPSTSTTHPTAANAEAVPTDGDIPLSLVPEATAAVSARGPDKNSTVRREDLVNGQIRLDAEHVPQQHANSVESAALHRPRPQEQNADGLVDTILPAQAVLIGTASLADFTKRMRTESQTSSDHNRRLAAEAPLDHWAVMKATNVLHSAHADGVAFELVEAIIRNIWKVA